MSFYFPLKAIFVAIRFISSGRLFQRRAALEGTSFKFVTKLGLEEPILVMAPEIYHLMRHFSLYITRVRNTLSSGLTSSSLSSFKSCSRSLNSIHFTSIQTKLRTKIHLPDMT